MLGQATPQHHDIIKKLTVLFGSLFTDIKINRDDSNGDQEQLIKVPLSYGPADKALARVRQQAELEQPYAISLPRMSFEFIDLQYDPNRAINALNRVQTEQYVSYAPKPYNFIFELYIMANAMVDATRILETILPHFTPQFNIPAKIVDGIDVGQDFQVSLNGSVKRDEYEGPFEQRRTLVWTLSFVISGWLWGPVEDISQRGDLIKKIEINYHAGMDVANTVSRTHIWPGVTEDGEPTTDPNEAIPYNEVQPTDNWDFIVEFLEG